MKILSVDTSSKNCSVSILEVDKNNFNVIITKNNDDEKTHSQKLMPMINTMFNESNLLLDDIDLLACCLGPGSFTGIRIGISSIKAFADVKNISTVGVTSLESLAYNVEKTGYICPIIDCKNNNVYSSLFFYDDNSYANKCENIAEDIDTVLNTFFNYLSSQNTSKTITFVGDGSIIYKDLITAKFAKFAKFDITFSDNNIQSSVSLGKCAYDKYLLGMAGNSNTLSPLYLRKSQAERAKNMEGCDLK